MRGLTKIINHFRLAKSNSILLAGTFALAVFALGGFVMFGQAQASSNPDNDIIRGGVSNGADFAAKCNADAPGDLHNIYGWYRIGCNDPVVEGQSCRNGTVSVNGRVVADNAQSEGRLPISGSHPISINGHTYYETPNSAAFLSECIPALVALDGNGNFMHAVLKPCGNPIYAHSVAPAPQPHPTPTPTPTPVCACSSLTATKITSTRQRFVAAATHGNGSQITSYMFDFGDGTSQQSTSSSVEHDYAQPGTYTARVTVQFWVNGQYVTATSPNCVVQVVITAPPATATCQSLQAIQRDRTTYDITINQTSTNATYQGATINYGDGTSNNITGTTDSHTFANVGTYHIVATLQFGTGTTAKTATCQATVTIQTEVCPLNSTLPKNSPQCIACQYNANLPANSSQCVACPYNANIANTSPDCVKAATVVTTLPVTGPMDGLLGAGVGAGGLIIATSFYLGSRRDLLASLLRG